MDRKAFWVKSNVARQAVLFCRPHSSRIKIKCVIDPKNKTISSENIYTLPNKVIIQAYTSCYIANKGNMCGVNWHRRPRPSHNFLSKPKAALYFLYFDFYWKLFPAPSESFHISESVVKGGEVRVGGSWLLSHRGQLQPPSPDTRSDEGKRLTIPAIWLLLARRHGHQR